MSRRCPIHHNSSAPKHHSNYCLRSRGPPSLSSSVSLPTAVQLLRKKRCHKLAAARNNEAESSASNTSNISGDRSDLLPSVVQEIRRRQSHKPAHICSKYRIKEGPLNINTCTEKMMRRVGLSANLSRKVMAFRRKNKVILHMNELWRMKGMNDDWYDDIQEVLGVGEITESLRQRAKAKSPRRCAARHSPSYYRPTGRTHSNHNLRLSSPSSHHIHENHPHDRHQQVSWSAPSSAGTSGLAHSHSQHQHFHHDPPNVCQTHTAPTKNDSICRMM